MRIGCLVVLLGLGASALAQDPASPPPGTDVDEVIVPGRRPENLRIEIERLENAVYERFNALNSNDEFDIHCLEVAPTGSNIPLRTCAPNFVIRAEARAGSDAVVNARSGVSGRNPAEHSTFMQRKSRELTAEMQRLAREDEQLLRDLTRLDELKQIQANEQGQAAKN